MNSYLVLQPCPAYLVCFTWMTCEIGVKWPYSFVFVRCCFLEALFPNTPAQAESQQHDLEQAAGGIGLYMNVNKTEFMCFKQEGDISTLSRGPLKLVDKFIYLDSNISSNESYFSVNLGKVSIYISILQKFSLYLLVCDMW